MPHTRYFWNCWFLTAKKKLYNLYVLQTKTLYISPAVSNYYGTEIEILVLGRLAILKKKLGRLCAAFEDDFFMFSWAKQNLKFLKKYCIVRSKKLHNISFTSLISFLLKIGLIFTINCLLETPPCATSV